MKKGTEEYRLNRARLNRNWIANNRERYNASKAKYRIKLKREVMALYANPVACVICGFSQLDGLVLDHIENNGSSHRKANKIGHRTSYTNVTGTRIYEHIRKVGKIAGMQVLCCNCNMIKQLRYSRSRTIKNAEYAAAIDKIADAHG